jgi:hypothetical protein
MNRIRSTRKMQTTRKTIDASDGSEGDAVT